MLSRVTRALLKLFVHSYYRKRGRKTSQTYDENIF